MAQPNHSTKTFSFFKAPLFFSNGVSNGNSGNNSGNQSPLNETSNIYDPVSRPSYDAPEHLNSLHSKLDYLLDDSSDESSETGDNVDSVKLLQIKRSHWKDITKAHRCDSCSKDLKFGFKKHNCRRCGEVFCESCCQYRKRLNSDSVPDPHGNIYRVCLLCADRHIQQVGRTRNLTELFCEQRKNKRLVITDELNRLITGFEKNVDPLSSLKSAINSLQVFKIPEWQKSSKWVDSSEVHDCMNCYFTFSFISRKHHCRLCGYVYCDKCCKDSLLLYFNDKHQGEAKLIGVVGCPDKEPPISLYLAICALCEEVLEEFQVQRYHHLESETSNVDEEGKICKLQSILDNLNVIQRKTDEALPSFHEQLETYIFEGNPEKNIHEQNNIELLAKAYSDISDLLTQYAIVIQGLKDLDMSSKIELKLMQNIISVKCNQYNTGMNTFKNLRSNMDRSFPSKSLEQFQKFANTQAINNTYVMTRQLGLEALKLAVKHSFGTLLAEKLSELDNVCYTELEHYLHAIGENKEEHLDVLNTLLRDQMKVKTLVLVDKELAERGGGEYVNSLLIQRCSVVLYRILKLLNAKSSETQFIKSKQHLQELLQFVTDLSNKVEKNRL